MDGTIIVAEANSAVRRPELEDNGDRPIAVEIEPPRPRVDEVVTVDAMLQSALYRVKDK